MIVIGMYPWWFYICTRWKWSKYRCVNGSRIGSYMGDIAGSSSFNMVNPRGKWWCAMFDSLSETRNQPEISKSAVTSACSWNLDDESCWICDKTMLSLHQKPLFFCRGLSTALITSPFLHFESDTWSTAAKHHQIYWQLVLRMPNLALSHPREIGHG